MVHPPPPLPHHIYFLNLKILNFMDGAVVRVLAFHQRGLGSFPRLGVICGLSLVLVLILASRGLIPTGFPFCSKTNVSKFQFALEAVPILKSTLIMQLCATGRCIQICKFLQMKGCQEKSQKLRLIIC